MQSKKYIERNRSYATLELTLIVAVACIIVLPATVSGWGSAHTAISQAALEIQPQVLRDLWSASHQVSGDTDGPRAISEYLTLYKFWSGNPDHACHNGFCDFLYYEVPWMYHYFVFSPKRNRDLAERGAKWYFERIIKSLNNGCPADAAQYAGGFAHALEDRSCPVHAWDGYSKEREILETRYASLGLQDKDKSFRGNAKSYSAIWFVNDNNMKVDIKGYNVKLLGDTPEKAATKVVKRLQAITDSVRKVCSEDPAVQGSFLNVHLKDKWYDKSYFHDTGPATVALLNKMAEQSAFLVADVFYTGYRLSLSSGRTANTTEQDNEAR